MYPRPVRPYVAPKPRRRTGRKLSIVVAVLFLLYLVWSWVAVPASAFGGSSASGGNLAPAGGTPSLAWPAGGQAAVGTAAYGVLATHGQQTAIPIASVAKVMLALSVLKKHPIANGTSGNTITLTQADVDIYNKYVAEDGSVALVAAGEQLTEYQALQALLLPSANNMADTLAVWAFGSVDAYDDYANSYAGQLGLSATHFADASGFDPGTVSSARDLVELGQKAMANPTIKDIVAQPSAFLPVAGTVYNVNRLLGHGGVVGIKTGNTDQAGGCLLFAAKHTVGGQTVTIVGAVLGAGNLSQALDLSSALLASADRNFAATTVTAKGTTLATYKTPWGESVTAVADDQLQAVTWAGGGISTYRSLDKLRLPVSNGQTVGRLVASSSPTQTRTSVPIVLNGTLHGPSLWWRLIHPFKTWQLRFS